MDSDNPTPASDLGESAADLDPDEAKKAVEEESLNAATTHEVIRRQGRKELERSASGLGWSGVAAGLSMGLSLVAQGVLRAALPDAPWRPLVVSAGYAVGFLAVILGSQQLFTENTLTPVVPLLTEWKLSLVGKVLKLWGVVLCANLVGVLVFALAIAHTHILAPEVTQAVHALAQESFAPTAGALFERGIMAGFIIALMLWMLPAAGSASVLVIFLMTWLVGATRLSHVVVGSVEAFYLAATGAVSFGTAVLHYILPTLAGNMLGGVTLVAAVNHAQVAAGKETPPRRWASPTRAATGRGRS